MFEPNKLKTNLKICSVRLRNLYQKKNELNIRSRSQLAEYLKAKKIDRARIRVEQIVREDYLLEVLEIIELYCELLTARFGLITSMAECDPGLIEAIATIIWVAPRLSYECQELNVLKFQFELKYGRDFAEACATNSNHNVNAKVMRKLNVKATSANLCEAYLVEIARSFDVSFTPDPNLLNNAPKFTDLGEPPELPSYDLMADNSDLLADIGAPYPTNSECKGDPSSALPSLPPKTNSHIPDSITANGSPPYRQSDRPTHKKSSEGDKNSKSSKDDKCDKNGSSTPPSSPSNDDAEFNSLSARFKNLLKGN